MRLYLNAESDTHQAVGLGGNNNITVKLLYGSKKEPRQAIKVTLERDPATDLVKYIIEGPRHQHVVDGTLFLDITSGTLPE
jgi:hypothetical protein